MESLEGVAVQQDARGVSLLTPQSLLLTPVTPPSLSSLTLYRLSPGAPGAPLCSPSYHRLHTSSRKSLKTSTRVATLQRMSILISSCLFALSSCEPQRHPKCPTLLSYKGQRGATPLLLLLVLLRVLLLLLLLLLRVLLLLLPLRLRLLLLLLLSLKLLLLLLLLLPLRLLLLLLPLRRLLLLQLFVLHLR